MVVCLERGADLHMAQLMSLPYTVSCFSEIHIGFTSLVPAHIRIVVDRGPLNVCVLVRDKHVLCILDMSVRYLLLSIKKTASTLALRHQMLTEI